MQLFADVPVLWELLKPRVLRSSHRDALEDFYGDQAGSYDDFRERLLPGRKELLDAVIPEGFSGLWIDIGGGTGRTVEYVARRLGPSARVIILDLCRSLLDCARARIDQHAWSNVEPLHADVTTCSEFTAAADVVTFSFSLSMIPDWSLALDAAKRMLRPGGVVGVVDFTCKEDRRSLSGIVYDVFWKNWFRYDGVRLNARHRFELQERFHTESLAILEARIPYMLGLKAPYYRFIGYK